MKALILAAGYATRLYPLTKQFPKPLLTVGERPIIDYIIEKLEAVDAIDEIAVVTNSKFISRFETWRKRLRTHKRISLVDDLTHDEKTKRGAIGDMHFAIAKKRIKDDLLVVGGDNLFDGGLGGFLHFAHAKRVSPVIGVYDIRNRKEARKYGVIKMDRKHAIVDFQEKPCRPASTLVAMCLYYFPKEKLRLINAYLKQKVDKKDATGFYIDWLRRQESVYGFVFYGRWYDIGHHKFYEEAQQEFA